MELIDRLQSAFIVSIGAVLGSNIRYIIYQRLCKIKKDFRVLLINCLASFLVGLFISITSHVSYSKYLYELGLFFLIGFLGSLSTFSTFIYDLFELYSQSKFSRALVLFIFSLVLGVISLALGFLLGTQ